MVTQRPRRPRGGAEKGGAGSVSSAGLIATMPTRISGQRAALSKPIFRREVIQTVVGTSAFTAVNYPINAGLAQMFLWLSSEARRYEKYRFRHLAFLYTNSVAPNNATDASGNVALAFDADVLDSAPATLQAMMQNESALLFSPYDKSRLVVDPGVLARRGWLYTRAGGVPTGADAKTYDLGSLILAQTGCSTNGLGVLSVEYIVEFDVPQEPPVIGQKATGSSGLTASALFGTDIANSAGSVAGWTFNTAGTVATCAVAGEYLITARHAGTVIVNGSATVGGTATSTSVSAVVNSAGTIALWQFVVRATVGQTIAPAIDSATTLTSSAWRFAAYPYALA